jgi:spore germination protein YaaH
MIILAVRVKYPAPSPPLKSSPNWISYQIEKSINYYLQKNIPDSLLLPGVPYFGALYETEDNKIPSKVTKFIGYRSYSSELSILKNLIYDTTLFTSYYCFPIKNRQHRQLWINGVYSLGKKYDYVLNKKLGGIAIWALGFDEGSNDL